jgi:hypothetical protein
MMRDRKGGRIIVALLVMAGLLSGCVNLGKGTERLPQLYLLTAMAPETENGSGRPPKDLSIGVGPLGFPEYLNRPQIVTRTSSRELQLERFANWAEPLEKNVQRVLVENIATLSKTDAVYGFPWRAGYAPRYQLQLEIVQFDAQPGGEALLAVRWEWLDQAGTPLMARQHSLLRRSVEGDRHETVVLTMSNLLQAFSRLAVARLASFRL